MKTTVFCPQLQHRATRNGEFEHKEMLSTCGGRDRAVQVIPETVVRVSSRDVNMRPWLTIAILVKRTFTVRRESRRTDKIKAKNNIHLSCGQWTQKS